MTSAVDTATPAERPPVPVEDVTRWHADIADELREAFEACLPAHRFTLGPNLREFEAEFAAYCGATAGIGISSGTAALALALRALGIGPGDEVITVPNTYVATVFAITYVGALPVFVDVDPLTANIDPARVAAAVTPATRAILPVHLYGQCVDMDALRAAAPGIPILEDAAHAHGATYGERRAGSLGEVAAFSFYPSKVMGALGDGGIITTSDPELEARLRQLRYMGQTSVKHEHLILGYQERLDELQAAFLRVKLGRIDGWIAARREVAARYARRFAAAGLDRTLTLPVERPGFTSTFNPYVVRAPRRDALREHLTRAGIGTSVYYPVPLPLQPCFAELGHRPGDFPESERAAAETLALPLFPALAEAEQAEVVRAVADFYAGGA